MKAVRRSPKSDSTPLSLVWLIGPAAFALAVKAAVLAQLGGHPLLQPHGALDTAYYVELARKVAAEGPLAVTEPFFVSPLYVFFLALIFKVTGGSLLAPRIFQVLLGAGSVALFYLTARRWFSERVARIGTVLFALTGFVTFSEILILPSALDPVLTSCVLYFASRSQADSRPWPLIAAGASVGLFSLNRPNALAYGVVLGFLIGAACWKALQGRPRTSPVQAAMGRMAAYFISLALVLAPNAWRNYAVSGEAILISSHGGLNFFMGNHAGADGTYQRIEGIEPSIAGQARDAKRLAEEGTGRPLSNSEVSDHFYLLAWDWISGHPLDAVGLFLRKAAILVNRTNVALNYSYDYYRGESTVLRFLIVGPWLLIPLGLPGLFLRSQRVRPAGFWVWASFLPVYGMSVVAFFVSDRYRLPLFLPLCATSAASIAWAADRLRMRRPAQWAIPVLVLCLACAVAWWNLGLNDGVDDERSIKAAWMVEQGDIEGALRYIEEIASRHSHPGQLRYQAGQALAAAARHEDALRQFIRALEIDGDRNSIRLALARELAALKRPGEAVPYLARAFEDGYQPKTTGPLLVWGLEASGRSDLAVQRLRSFSDDMAEQPETALYFGNLALQAKDPAEAERWSRLAAARAPQSIEPLLQLGAALLLQNKAQAAVPAFESAIRMDPENAMAHRGLALAYANCGRFADARTEGSRALRLNPGDIQVLSLLRSLPTK